MFFFIAKTNEPWYDKEDNIDGYRHGHPHLPAGCFYREVSVWQHLMKALCSASC